MSKKRIPKSVKKYIRLLKADLRRSSSPEDVFAERIAEAYKRILKDGFAKKS